MMPIKYNDISIKKMPEQMNLRFSVPAFLSYSVYIR